MVWPCFWVEPTGEEEIGLRRYASGSCPGMPGGWHHNAIVMVGRGPELINERGHRSVPPVADYETDPRWPTKCEHCEYTFRAGTPTETSRDDPWQVWTERIWRRPDTGEEWGDRRLPPGAMLNASWRHNTQEVGPDGLSLTVVLPPDTEDSRGHWWCVDGPATGGGELKYHAWSRTGDPKAVPPTVAANPSIAAPGYHGFLVLQDGRSVLTDPL